MQKHTCQRIDMIKNTFGERLREERVRLGLTQDAFGAVGGVKKLAQIAYEQDKRFPDVGYVLALSAIGVDVGYVMFAKPTLEGLQQDESELLAGYRSLDIRGKAGVLGMIEGMSTTSVIKSSQSGSHATAPTVVIHGKVGQQITGDITGKQTFNIGDRKKEKQPKID